MACPIVDRLRIVVMEIGGRGPSWLCESAAYKVAERGVPFRPSCAVVIQVTSFVRLFVVSVDSGSLLARGTARATWREMDGRGASAK